MDWVSLPDLYVHGPGGVKTTKGNGYFGGNIGGFPGGLGGPYERVTYLGVRHPGTTNGFINLNYSGDDPRLDEVTTFYYLAKTRRWMEKTMPGLPKRTSRARMLAVVRHAAFANAFAMPEPAESARTTAT